jgi:hypothetical protein
MCKDTMTNCGNVYAVLFMTISLLILTFIMSDFFYVITDLVSTYDYSNTYSIIMSNTKMCII